jgi:Leucine-rich repeat (LRR) protein
MDIIQSQREDILRDDNTAQASLANILDGLKTDTVELIVDSPMHGSLDLSILKTMKFDRIHTIVFGKGQITELTNVPNGISKLVCSDNLLTELDDLPNSLLYLDFSRNFLTSFDFAKVSHLEEIHCEDNKITEFLNIPSSIISIYCDNNDLKHLDLKGLKKLTTVHCSNNPIIIIDSFCGTSSPV